MLPIGPGAVKQEMTFPESWVWRGDTSVGRVADQKKWALGNECRIVIDRTDVRKPFMLWVQDHVRIQVLTRFFTTFV